MEIDGQTAEAAASINQNSTKPPFSCTLTWRRAHDEGVKYDLDAASLCQCLAGGVRIFFGLDDAPKILAHEQNPQFLARYKRRGRAA